MASPYERQHVDVGVVADQDGSTSMSGTYDYTSGGSTTENIPDILLLNHLCASASEARAETWEQVREWLRSHQAEEVRQAAEQRGDSNMTALHFACRNSPPSDVIDVFLSIAIETVQWPDSFGWLPIHYACACGASVDVIQSLAEAYPESKTTVDRRGRTPLHFALGNSTDKPASPEVVALLSSTGAASYADDNGMLPLHYACAYGSSVESLNVLTEAYPDAITSQDLRHRTPLHFCLSNAGRPASPGAVRLLLSINKDVVNNSEGGTLPLRVLADFSQTVSNQPEVHPNVNMCLECLLNAEPTPTADFFTALQSLPDWLKDGAVVMPAVQHLLNEKISQRFPTFILILDFYVLVMIIFAYSFYVIDSIEARFASQEENSTVDRTIDGAKLSPLYIGCAYFIFREVIQIISLLSLKSFHIWLRDISNWVNVVFVFLILYWTILMQTGAGDDVGFRTGTAISAVILWVKVLAFMRGMLIDFAVFVGGVFYVVQRLAAFLMALIIILVAFAQMFYTVFQQTPECTESQDNRLELICANLDDDAPFCDFWTAFLRVYTMLLGEVDETDFDGSPFGIALFVLFMFLVVILLANVLIAIVTDSYKVIQDQRAAIVFWTNRLDFVAEMDAIANGPWKGKLRKALGLGVGNPAPPTEKKNFGQEFWRRLMDLFEDEYLEGQGMCSVEFWCYSFLRAATALIIIPAWIFIGLLTMGWLWPPQVREGIFKASVSKHSSDADLEDELRKTQVRNVKKEVKVLREELLQELAVDRTHMVQMKSQVADRKAEIANEMKHIKRIMAMLFEQHASFEG